MGKRLYKSRSERMLFGVSGGMAEYFDLDPTLVRIAWVVIALLTAGMGFLAYVALAIIVPDAPARRRPVGGEAGNTEEEAAGAYDPVDSGDEREIYESAESSVRGSGRRRSIIFGAVLIALGLFFLAITLDILPQFDWRFWPVALILLGALLVARRIGEEN